MILGIAPRDNRRPSQDPDKSQRLSVSCEMQPGENEALDVAVSLHAVIFGVVASLALLLPGATLDAASGAAEAIRLAFQAWRDPALDAGHALSTSFGVAMLQDAEPEQDAIARADDALYRAKREGRNRVTVRAAAAKPARLVAAT